MSEENRARAIRWMEDNWNNRQDKVVEDLMHAEFFGRMEGGDLVEGAEIRGHGQWRDARNQLLAAFPDIKMVWGYDTWNMGGLIQHLTVPA